MTNPTLERAARALHESRSMCPWDTLSSDDRALCFSYARAVLMAVREPGREECYAVADRVGDGYSPYEPVPTVFFTAMIDAILNDGQEPPLTD